MPALIMRPVATAEVKQAASPAGDHPSSFDALLFAATSQLDQASQRQQARPPAHITQLRSQLRSQPGPSGTVSRSPSPGSQKVPTAAAAIKASRKRRSSTPLDVAAKAEPGKQGKHRGPAPELLAVPTAATKRCQSLLSSAKAAIREAQELAGQTAAGMSKLGWPSTAAAAPLAAPPSRAKGSQGGRAKAGLAAESGTLVAPQQPLPASPVEFAARQQRSPRKAQPAGAAPAPQPLPQQMHLLAQLQAAQQQQEQRRRLHDRQRQQEVQQQERGLLLERQHALAQLQLAALRQQLAAQGAPPSPHGLQSTSLASVGEQRSWPLAQPGRLAAAQQQHEPQLFQQLIAAGRLGSHTAGGVSPRGQASSAVEAAYAAASAMQASRQRSLSDPELGVAPPGSASGSLPARPVPRRAQPPAPLQQPEEPLPASALEEPHEPLTSGVRHPTALRPSHLGSLVNTEAEAAILQAAASAGVLQAAAGGSSRGAVSSAGVHGLAQSGFQQQPLAAPVGASASQHPGAPQPPSAAAIQAALEVLAASSHLRSATSVQGVAAAKLLAAAGAANAGMDGTFAANAAAQRTAPALWPCQGCGAAKLAEEFPLSTRNSGRLVPRCKACCSAAVLGTTAGSTSRASSPVKSQSYRRSLSDSAASQHRHETLRRISDETNTLQRLSNSSQLSAFTAAGINSSGSLSASGSLHRGSHSINSQADGTAAGSMLGEWGAKRRRMDPFGAPVSAAGTR